MSLFKSKYSLSVLLLIELLCFVILTFSTVYVLRRQNQANEKLNVAIRLRYTSFLLADQLRQSSDDLTRMVRTYAVTGQDKYRKYFQTILNIRNGKEPRPKNYERIFWDFRAAETRVYKSVKGEKIALNTLMKKAGFSKKEFQLLAKAKRRSDKLVELEELAMNAMKGLFKDSNGAFTIRKSPDKKYAIGILFSPKYHLAKKAIMKPIDRFFASIDNRTSRVLEARQREMRSLSETLAFLFILLVGFIPMLTFTLYVYRRISNTELQKSEEKYRFLAEQPGQLVYDIHLATGFVLWSGDVKGIRDVHGLTHTTEAVAWLPFIHPSDREHTVTIYDKAKKHSERYECTYRLLGKEEDYRHVEDCGLFLSNSSGEVYRMLGVIKDITERKRSEQEKIELQRELHHHQKMDAIGQLAGGIAHDFNNMLTGVMGAADLLVSTDNRLSESDKKHINVITQATQRAADLASKLLEFGRKNSDGFAPTNIHELLDDSVAILKSTIDKKIQLSIKKEAQNPFVYGDNSYIQNAFLNIALNASHAMPKGGDLFIQTKNVLLNEEECASSPFAIEPGTYVEILFQDSGHGIPQENLQKIFEPFFTTKAPEKGTGLGLSSVYGTIQAHRGSVSVSSQQGKGSLFRIMLPCSKKQRDKQTPVRQLRKGSETILFVDDEELLRLIGKRTLTRMGYRVLLADNGEEAIHIFRERQEEIDLVLMDITMPKMNGYEAFVQIREIDKTCKVILSSGVHSQKELDRLRLSGLTGYISKPYRDFELSQILADALQKTTGEHSKISHEADTPPDSLVQSSSTSTKNSTEQKVSTPPIQLVESGNTSDEQALHSGLDDLYLALLHDLRGYTGAIIHLAGLLSKETTLSQEHQRFCSMLYQAGNKIKALLQLSPHLIQMEGGMVDKDFSLQNESIDLLALLQNTVEKLEQLANKSQLSIELYVEGQPLSHAQGISFIGERFSCGDILYKLLTEAIETSVQPGKITIEVTTSTPITIQIHNQRAKPATEGLKRLTQKDLLLRAPQMGIKEYRAKFMAQVFSERVIVESAEKEGTTTTITIPLFG